MDDVQEITVRYYNDNAVDFVNQTQQVDFAEIQQCFLQYIPDGGHILDFGCGSGRDSHYFRSRGFRVTALDGAENVASLAEDFIRQKVVRQSFTDFAEIDVYDGVWACASLLHLPWQTLKQVVRNLAAGLHNEGIFYASFKYGDFSGMRHGRFFTDLTEERWHLLTEGINWDTLDLWVTGDVREGRSNEQWLNILCKKR